MDVQPLLTLGDTIESFLNDNDPYTAGSCMLSILDLNKPSHQRNFLDGLYEMVAPKDGQKH